MTDQDVPKMSDIYINEMLKGIRNAIDENHFLEVGSKFFKLAHYGIVIKNKLVVFLCSELADVFRNCLLDFDSYRDEFPDVMFSGLRDNVRNLLVYIEKNKEINDKDKIEIFDLLHNIIFTAETIQERTSELEINKRKYIGRERIL